MGTLYRRTKRNPATGEREECGPWWRKFYDHGKAIRRSTKKHEKSEAKKVLLRATMQVLEGRLEGGQVHRTKFEDSWRT